MYFLKILFPYGVLNMRRFNSMAINPRLQSHVHANSHNIAPHMTKYVVKLSDMAKNRRDPDFQS